MPTKNDLRDKKIGLVLAGGGGKGAYQAGCLMGLYELGIHRFHVVCGTSIGSLNGAAAAAGKIPELLDLWQEVAYTSGFRLSWRIPIYFLGETAAWILISQRTITGIIVDVILILTCAGVYAYSRDIRYFVLITFVGLMYIVVGLQSKLFWLIGGVGNLLRRWVETSSSVATNSALSRTIENFLYSEGGNLISFHCPMFATIARDGYWFDPDFPTFLPVIGLGQGDSDIHLDVERPLPAHGWLPEYVDISNLSKLRVIESLLQSACLPHAFRRMWLGDYSVIDGGIVDNIPLNKCLEYDCDVIIVLHLNADSAAPQRLLDQIPRLRRALRCESADQAALHRQYLEWLHTFNSDSADDHHDNSAGETMRYYHAWDLPATRAYVLIPLAPLDALPTIIHVIPKQSLGGLLTGTLNFRKSKVRRLIIKGRDDIIDILHMNKCLHS